MRSEPYHDELHTFWGDTEQRRHRRNGGSSCAMDERRCRHDMMKGVVIPQAEICLLKRLRMLKLATFHFPSARFRQCFEQLTVLSTVSLVSEQQNIISRATFYPFRGSLTNLLLINCGMRRLHVDMFNDLSKLVVLVLSQNEITDLPSNIIASLTRLRQVDIAGNKLRVISPALLRPLRSLINLNIGYNTHMNITFGEEFLNMTRLQKIVLNGIKLTSLNNDTFRHLRNSPVVEVVMSTCSLRTISRGALLPLRNLTILSLDRNPLNASVLNDAFYGLHGGPLHELRISNTNVRVFSPTLFDGLKDNNIKTVFFQKFLHFIHKKRIIAQFANRHHTRLDRQQDRRNRRLLIRRLDHAIALGARQKQYR